jgi:predicted DCC family thiol-disulfide oxidoreductase YuxK
MFVEKSMSKMVRNIQKYFANKNVILYDGDCIYCQKYTEFVRIRQSLGSVVMEDLRKHPSIIKMLRENNIEPNEGMLFVTEDKFYWGSDAIHALAQVSTHSGVLNRLQKTILGNRNLSRLFYPLMKIGRRVTLFLRGKRLIP